MDRSSSSNGSSIDANSGSIGSSPIAAAVEMVAEPM
jgi:hypothetical protein